MKLRFEKLTNTRRSCGWWNFVNYGNCDLIMILYLLRKRLT